MTLELQPLAIPEHGLDYLLAHFELLGGKYWPRTISTHATKGVQIKVGSREEVLDFEQY